jgi:hypothetical protein
MSSERAPRFCLSSKNRLPWRCRHAPWLTCRRIRGEHRPPRRTGAPIPQETRAHRADGCGSRVGNGHDPAGWAWHPPGVMDASAPATAASGRYHQTLRPENPVIRLEARAHPPGSPRSSARERRSSNRRPAVIRPGAALVQPEARAPPRGSDAYPGRKPARIRLGAGLIGLQVASHGPEGRAHPRGEAESFLLAALRPGGSPSPLRGA